VLTEEQNLIVNCSHRHFKVLSAAGSGKTTVLISRLHRLCTDGVKGERIMAITFTRRAGKELRNRASFSFPELSKATIGTFHSCILKTMQKNGTNPNVLTEEESNGIILECANKLGIRVGGKMRGTSLSQLRKEIRDYRNDEGAETPVVKMYLSELAIHGDLDYDGILTAGLNMARNGKFDWVEHLFVDEAQDNEPLQWRFVNEIAKKSSVMVVGDVGQSLYEFRGAVPDQFEKQPWPELGMTRSFRFPANIAKSVNRIGATPLKVVSDKTPTPVRKHKTSDVCGFIKSLMRAGAGGSDIAVLCRYNRQVDQVRGALLDAGIKVVVPQVKWYGPIHYLLMYLASPGSRVARERVACWNGSYPNLVRYINSSLSISESASVARTFLQSCGNRIYNIIGYLNVLNGDSHMRHEAVDILAEYGPRTVEEYAAEESQPEWVAEGEGVTAGTVHWAKGGEWPIVIIPFMDKGTWPRGKKTAEEKRILYVAATRTMEELHLLHGDEPSPFLDYF
jgi:superfamily I DNA/RNA helicase